MGLLLGVEGDVAVGRFKVSSAIMLACKTTHLQGMRREKDLYILTEKVNRGEGGIEKRKFCRLRFRVIRSRARCQTSIGTPYNHGTTHSDVSEVRERINIKGTGRLLAASPPVLQMQKP